MATVAVTEKTPQEVVEGIVDAAVEAVEAVEEAVEGVVEEVSTLGDLGANVSYCAGCRFTWSKGRVARCSMRPTTRGEKGGSPIQCQNRGGFFSLFYFLFYFHCSGLSRLILV